MTLRPHPKPGSVWLHRNGNEYTVILLTNTEGDDPAKWAKFPVTVVYHGSDGRYWSLPLSEWHANRTLQPTKAEEHLDPLVTIPRQELLEIKDAIKGGGVAGHMNELSVACTVWVGQGETVVDRLNHWLGLEE